MGAKISVGIVGATGMVGQQFVRLLQGHPWFEITALTGSERSAGRPYGEACTWVVPGEMPPALREEIVQSTTPDIDCRVVFSALPGSVAGPIEEELAAAGFAVFSKASSHRMDANVPLLITEVNPGHLALIHAQRRQRGWDSGFIVNDPNCSTIGLAMALKPLHDRFGVEEVMVTTMQGLSGAGYPGVSGFDIVDNVVPYISGEEEKMETEPLKILGQLEGEEIHPAEFAISAQCNRVNVRDGHLAATSVRLRREASAEEIIEAWETFRGLPQELELPSAPEQPIIVRQERDRPQPRLDRDAGGGMAVTVGHLRSCPILGWKFLALVHNTIRGAAGTAILDAELMKVQGYLE
ncbi:MAG: aspartate-semialdehyde dehydrogenase [Chloroflexota bacterium]|nr:aspartate-semialdehyde dehydrogenase [Chloroflexota bacterium]